MCQSKVAWSVPRQMAGLAAWPNCVSQGRYWFKGRAYASPIAGGTEGLPTSVRASKWRTDRTIACCNDYPSAEQQGDSLWLPRVASFLPVRAAWIIAAAHPTPLSTVTASVGQLSWQAPHSIHASGRTSLAKRPFIANTPCGQTMLHIAQPVHSSWSYRSVLSADTLNMMILPTFR